MTRAELIELVERYFSAVDAEDWAVLSATLAAECVFSVETHGVRLDGIEAIEAMFRRLWSDHAAVRHQDFVHVPYPRKNRIASRFLVINTHHDGRLVHKSNCNFFEASRGRFDRVAVYMAGENTLDKD